MNENEMMNHNAQLPATLQNKIDRARERSKAARSKNTRKAYESDWNQFLKWCQTNNVPSLPSNPAVVILYIDDLAEERKKVTTIKRHITSISQKHQEKGFESPTKHNNVRLHVKAIENELGTRQKQKTAATATIIKKLCDHLPANLKGLRDRSILQVGFAGALRRSEIAALDVEEIEFHEEGMTILLKKSKTDQSGDGKLIGIEYGHYPYCPVRTLRSWLKESNIKNGAVFPSMNKAGRLLSRITTRSIARIIKNAANRSGFDEEEFSGHSLRRGFITTAKRKGTDEFNIMGHTRHESIETMRRYIDKSDVFKNNPTKGIWD
ncbi:site-specific integrase [Shimazuella kribbensis]|uniref:site-specific integrase n=1 Tax=Shimazuella kribbensis TaxID=139808 RepID=UPI000421D66B|nr:site-specific integrase [Shimazuella kribbensis]